MKVRFLEAAEEEMLSAAERYEREVPELGEAFLVEIRRVVDLVASRPRIGAPVSKDTRGAFLRRFPYTVIYGEAGDELLIVAVAHHRRRPGYWKDRLTR